MTCCGSGLSFLVVFLAHTTFYLPILHAETIPANLKKSEIDQEDFKSVEPPEYKTEYFDALYLSSGSSGI